MTNLVLIQPKLTEKSLNNQNIYVFTVGLSSTKHQIKAQVEKIYNVKVGQVRTIVSKGKVKLVGKKRVKKRLAHSKKAYITLTKGKIEDFPKNN